jgi:hypothetical protein
MSIPEDKERFTFVVDKNIKAKLQILADRDNRKLGNYVSKILDEHIFAYENKIFQKHGARDFEKYYFHIFEQNLEPHHLVQIMIDFDESDFEESLEAKIDMISKRMDEDDNK